MSNKLYTEEQVFNLFENFKLHLPFHYELLLKEHISNIEPIELPSDEEIDNEASNYIENGSSNSFRIGAIWMRDKIQGGNK